MKEIKRVYVVGGGLMGRQIGLNTALYGYEVSLTDTNDAVLESAKAWKDEYLDQRIQKGKMTKEEADRVNACFHLVGSLEDAAKNVDLVIEAIIEDQKIKEELFSKLSKMVADDTIIVSNSSYMPSSMFASLLKNPSRLANLHYFNPALVMKLTEVVQGPHTGVETIEALLDFSRKTGKEPVWVRKEIDGFIANRIVRAITNEALYLLSEGIATPEEIDIVAEKGLNHPMGPFRLQDLTGIDLAYLAAKKIVDETGYKKPGYDRLEQKYFAKEYGRKTAKGWYDYTK